MNEDGRGANALMMNKIVLLVGVPGSGKTTLAQRLIEKGYISLNADKIREELFGDPTVQSDNDAVFSIFFGRLEDELAKGSDVVIDNTNTNPKHRGPILQRAIQAGYNDIQIWVLDTPLDICLERNRARGREVPEDIVTKMYQTITGPGKPQRHEGKLVIIRPGERPNEFRFFLPK